MASVQIAAYSAAPEGGDEGSVSNAATAEMATKSHLSQGDVSSSCLPGALLEPSCDIVVLPPKGWISLLNYDQRPTTYCHRRIEAYRKLCQPALNKTYSCAGHDLVV
ncbi:MAG: hypothetical protein ABR992_12095 [Solirubrobacteraceae bacterium]